MSQPHITVSHDELLRDYAGYEFIQEEMEALIVRFLILYHQEILALYGITEQTIALEAFAAGAGASKFVFGVWVRGSAEDWVFGLRLYNSKASMKDKDKTYDAAEEYQIGLETHDQPLLEALVDEMRVYAEQETPTAKTGIDVHKNWLRFPVPTNLYANTAYAAYIDELSYLEDEELKRLMVNLGINAFTVGGFVLGYDGRKILERPEFGEKQKQDAVVHISNTMLQIWLDTMRPGPANEYLGRTIVDLKPAQFVVQTDEMLNTLYLPAALIDVGPAEHTENIYTYFKTLKYMKELIPAFAKEMVGKALFPEQSKAAARRAICQQILEYLDHCKQTGSRLQAHEPIVFVNISAGRRGICLFSFA